MAILGCILLAAHGIIVTHQAVNIPVADEWEYFVPGALGPKITFEWLVSLHNEHRIVFTRLLAWVLLHTTHLNLVVNIAINFAIYCGLCWLLLRLLKPGTNTPMGIAWVILASGVLHEVHMWAFLSQFHFYALFFVLGLLALRRHDAGSWWVIPCAIASAYSFAGGFFCGVALGVATLLFAWLRPAERQRHIIQGMLTLGGVATWLIGFKKNPGHPPFEPPWRATFWKHILTTLSDGIGLDSNGWLAAYRGPGLVIGGIFLLVTTLLLAREAYNLSLGGPAAERAAVRVTFAAALLVGMGATSMARAGFGVDCHVPPRYIYPVVLLLPLVWVLAYEHFLSRRRLATLIAAAGILLPLVHEMDFNRFYRPQHRGLMAVQACVDAYWRGEGAFCPSAYPADLAPRLQRARELQISFVRGSASTIVSSAAQ